jgi:hypothetical protein
MEAVPFYCLPRAELVFTERPTFAEDEIDLLARDHINDVK